MIKVYKHVIFVLGVASLYFVIIAITIHLQYPNLYNNAVFALKGEQVQEFLFVVEEGYSWFGHVPRPIPSVAVR